MNVWHNDGGDTCLWRTATSRQAPGAVYKSWAHEQEHKDGRDDFYGCRDRDQIVDLPFGVLEISALPCGAMRRCKSCLWQALTRASHACARERGMPDAFVGAIWPRD